MLLGNLETGIIGDSRAPREITFTLNRAVLELADVLPVLEDTDGGRPVPPLSATDDTLTYRVGVASQGSAVYRLRAGA